MNSSTGNRLLAQLLSSAAGRLRPHLHAVELERREIVFRAHEPIPAVYFPTTAVLSLVTRIESGHSLEVGLVGHDGVVGAGSLPTNRFGCDAVVQIGGSAFRIDAEVLRRVQLLDAATNSAVNGYSQLLLMRAMYLSACNVFHSVEQRCVRWLLTMDDLVGHQQIPLTHEELGAILGVHRPTITHVIGVLHRSGLIDEHRGRLAAIDRARLESLSCDCYTRIRDATLLLS
jgi:CRP-like cAMP-binding protein